ncbi:tetratricopeptide repeat protein [Methanobacterium petrolearium]|uniref:tetratricopeptide repeat protein n=2 Tax=Methanobacterium petrolearium TaxID=710190 RepID=UPI001AE19DEA|nr:tetratricopeptide repeat protein [Methanobacterium petrolearium]
MKKSSSDIIVGSILLLCTLLYSLTATGFSDMFIAICFGPFGVLLLLSGIFNRLEYYNKTLFMRIIVASSIGIGLLIFFKLYQFSNTRDIWVSLFFTVLAGIYLLGMIWTGYGYSKRMDEYRRIEESFKKTIKSDNEVMAWNRKGLQLMKIKEYRKAIDSFDKALELEPSNVMILNIKGISLTEIRKFSRASKVFDKALKLDPENTKVLNNKGNNLTKAFKHQEAIDCYNKALKINPDNSRVLYNKGIAMGMLEKYQNSVECFNRALKLDPENSELWHTKGNALLKLGEDQEAQECYDKALDLDPNFKPVK